MLFSVVTFDLHFKIYVYSVFSLVFVGAIIKGIPPVVKLTFPFSSLYIIFE